MKKQKHMIVIGALTLCGSLLVAVPSSFAAKSMDDKDMDRTTAAGQPVVDVGNGQQTITDNSLYTVNVSLDGQNAISGDSVVNAAGINNVGVGVNVANVDGGGSVDQLNDIEQTHGTPATIGTLTWLDGTVSTTPGDVSGDMNIATLTASGTVKVGHGDQTVEDDSTYSVEITDEAQSGAVALSTVNAAGLNNVAVAINAANQNYTFGVGGATVGASTISQLNTIIQSN